MRPALHFTPQHGWMNDPNGLIEHDGRHHLFFQHNPADTRFGLMRWGHAVSDDLLDWAELPSALVPGEGGQRYDADGCFSGCAFVNDGRPTILYTGVEGDMQLPCLAVTEDDGLVSWRRSEDNPVIDRRPPGLAVIAFRDHSVRLVDGIWHQVVGGGTADGGGTVFAYRSKDLVEWEYEGVLLDSRAAGVPGTIWECPDLFVVDGRAVLMVSLIGPPEQPVLWLVGDLADDGFTPTTYGMVDLGTRFYAPQSYWTSDGRRVMLGWLREHLEAGAQGSGERVGVMSLPRELRVTDGRLVSRPAREVDAARREVVGRTTAHGTAALDIGLDCFELTLSAAEPAALARAVLRLESAGSAFEVDLAGLLAEPVCYRRDGDGWAPETAQAREARVLFDRGVIEAFLDSGLAAAWTPTRELTSVERITVSGGSAALDVTVRRLAAPGE